MFKIFESENILVLPFIQTHLIHKKGLNERLKGVLKLFFGTLALFGQKYGKWDSQQTNVMGKQLILKT